MCFAKDGALEEGRCEFTEVFIVVVGYVGQRGVRFRGQLATDVFFFEAHATISSLE